MNVTPIRQPFVASFMRKSLPYQPVARKLLLEEEIEPGELTRFVMDGSGPKVYIVMKRGGVTRTMNDAYDLFIPLFELACYPVTRLSEERNYPGAHKQFLTHVEESICRAEDVEVFKTLNAAVPDDHSFTIATKITPKAIRNAMALIEEHELVCEAITMHFHQFAELDEISHPNLITFCAKDARRTGVWGYFHNVPIYVNAMCPKTAVFVTTAKDILGRIVVRKEIESIDANEPEKMRVGNVIYKEVGFGLLVDDGCARIICEQTLDSQNGDTVSYRIVSDPPAPPVEYGKGTRLKEYRKPKTTEFTRDCNNEATRFQIERTLSNLENLFLTPAELESVDAMIADLKSQRVVNHDAPKTAQ